MPLQTTTSTWYSEEHRLYTESVRKFFADRTGTEYPTLDRRGHR